jgi:hypothetical protein
MELGMFRFIDECAASRAGPAGGATCFSAQTFLI